MYWFIKLLIDNVPPDINTEIGTQTNMEINILVKTHLIVGNSGYWVIVIGSNAMNEMNHPAPNGNGK